MPPYRIGGRIVDVAAGSSLGSVQRFTATVRDDPRVLPGSGLLVDARKATYEPTWAETRSIAQDLQEASKFTACAVVVAKALHFGIARQFQIHSEMLGTIPVWVGRDIDEAKHWLATQVDRPTTAVAGPHGSYTLPTQAGTVRPVPKLPKSGFLRIASVEACDVEYRAGCRAATTWNVSVLGAYVVIHPVPDVNEHLRLSFRLPEDPHPIRAVGRVAWQNPPSPVKGVGVRAADLPPGCGVEFLAIDPEDRRRIEARVGAVKSLGGP